MNNQILNMHIMQLCYISLLSVWYSLTEIYFNNKNEKEIN